MSRHSKVIVQIDRHTDRQYENITFPHPRAVIISKGKRFGMKGYARTDSFSDNV